jgi:hypothetical protein
MSTVLTTALGLALDVASQVAEGSGGAFGGGEAGNVLAATLSKQITVVGIGVEGLATVATAPEDVYWDLLGDKI